MAKNQMHADELRIDAELVRELLASQFPDLAGLSIDAVDSTGTVNAIYRLGRDLCVRMPRVRKWAGGLEKEVRWLPALAPRLPLAVPEPVAKGAPSADYPLPWAIYRWLDGEPFTLDGVRDDCEAARDLAGFVTELRGIDTAGAPRSRRDRPLIERDPETRAVMGLLRGTIDTAAVTEVWETSLRVPAWSGIPVWTHGDLLPPNLLVRAARLSAVIDFGSVGIGDPAVDVIPAWSVFGDPGRRAFRDALGVDDATWARGRGLALRQALLIIPYYPVTNPEFVAMAVRTVDEVLADSRS